VGAAVGCFHDAGAAAGGDDEAMAAGGRKSAGPGGDHVSQAAGVFVQGNGPGNAAIVEPQIPRPVLNMPCMVFFYQSQKLIKIREY